MITLRDKINKIVDKFGYICLKVERNIQGTLEIELDKNLMLDKRQNQLIDEVKNAVKPLVVDDIYYTTI